jgi:hypothetical protein
MLSVSRAFETGGGKAGRVPAFCFAPKKIFPIPQALRSAEELKKPHSTGKNWAFSLENSPKSSRFDPAKGQLWTPASSAILIIGKV